MSSREGKGLRHWFRKRLSRSRTSFSDAASPQTQHRAQTVPTESADHLTQLNRDVTSSLSTSQSGHISAVVCDVAATTATRLESNRENPNRSGSSQPCQKRSLDDVNEPSLFSPDVWSFAFREALDSIGSDIDVAILQGENAETLLKELQELDRESSQESAFRRGVEHLQRLKIPLETIKLALDIATPVVAIEPTASMAIGVVRSVTAVAISLASADEGFAKSIGEMLEHMQYIDGCDTLGRRSNDKLIHEALVSVYKKLLEFYKVAFDILTSKGVRLVINLMWETLQSRRLPEIVQAFVRHASTLDKLISKATNEIALDIKDILIQKQIAGWLGGADMNGQSGSHEEMCALRSDKACDWLLKHPSFVQWHTSADVHQLLLLGEMGSGKSVVVSYLIDSLTRFSNHQLPRPLVCYYYCSDGSTLSATKLYLVLISSLTIKLPGLRKTFYEWYQERQAAANIEPSMDSRQLGDFLRDVLEDLDRPLFIVVDGLDECERNTRYNICEFLAAVCKKSPRVKTFLSSRIEEEVLETLSDITTIRIPTDAKRDHIIVEHLVKNNLPRLEREVETLVIERMSSLAQGSAIWIKMTIELIEKKGIRNRYKMRRLLDNASSSDKLLDLYAALFMKCAGKDQENQELATTALKLLTVSRRPLSILELAWGVTLAIDANQVGSVADLAERIDYQRTMHLIRPFVSRIDFADLKKHQVRFVHQSVKRFVLESPIMNQLYSHNLIGQPTALEHGTSSTLQLERSILDVCVAYLLLDEVGRINLFSEEQVMIDALPQEIDIYTYAPGSDTIDMTCTWDEWEETMAHYDPAERGLGEFFVYASCYWTEHLSAVESGPFLKRDELERLCEAGSMRLANWIEQYRRPSCALQPRFEFDSHLYDPLSITSLYGSEAMMQHTFGTCDFTKAAYLEYPAIKAASQILQWGNFTRLQVLFKNATLQDQLCSLEFYQLIMTHWKRTDYHRSWETAFEYVIERTIDALIRKHLANRVLCECAKRGCLPIIHRLFSREHDGGKFRTAALRIDDEESSLPANTRPVQQSVGEAVIGNHADVVKYLLQQEGIEGHLHYRNERGENALHLASELCNPHIFDLLVPHLEDCIRQTDRDGLIPLLRVIKGPAGAKERLEATESLLRQKDGTAFRYSWTERQAALRAATELGDTSIRQLLLNVTDLPNADAEREDCASTGALKG